jgi:hypothetical protein
MTTSGILTGDLRHRRHRPVAHTFGHRVWHLLVDVDELPRLDVEVAGFGWNRPAVVTLRDTDHLGPVDLPLREKLRRFLLGHGVALPAGRVLLQASPRVLGHTFNPVSWWWCHDPDGDLVLVVAEVRNTFGDTHCYVLTDLERRGHDVVARDTKVFHVSPFLPVEPLGYRFRFRPPSVAGVTGERVVVHMDVDDDEGRILDATTAQDRAQLTTASLWRTLRRMPLMTLKTVAGIHWQALFIWRRKADFHRRPEPPPTGYDAIDAPVGAGARTD